MQNLQMCLTPARLHGHVLSGKRGRIKIFSSYGTTPLRVCGMEHVKGLPVGFRFRGIFWVCSRQRCARRVPSRLMTMYPAT